MSESQGKGNKPEQQPSSLEIKIQMHLGKLYYENLVLRDALEKAKSK